MAKTLQIRQGSGDHGRDVAMVLAIAERLTVNDDLVLGINDSLAVISLDNPVGSHHHGRIIVRNITLLFSTSRALLGLVFGQPFIKQLCLLL
jgi:hypothetical protein